MSGIPISAVEHSDSIISLFRETVEELNEAALIVKLREVSEIRPCSVQNRLTLSSGREDILPNYQAGIMKFCSNEVFLKCWL